MEQRSTGLSMLLDHLVAADALSSPLDEARRLRARAVLGAFGFVARGSGLVLDDTYPYVTVEEDAGLLHVHVETPLPNHLGPQVFAALEGLVGEAGLVRIDPITRGEIAAGEWARRVARTPISAPGRGLP